MKRVLAVCVAVISTSTMAESAMVLHYQEREAGVAPYPLRMLITLDYVRVDDGNDEGGFVLYDRKLRRIYNVIEEDAEVLIVDPEEPLGLSLPKVQLSHSTFSVTDAPRIENIAPSGFHLLADGEKCAHTIVVPGLFPAASAAMVEFQNQLGKQSMTTLKNTPASFQTPCFLAENILQPGWNWQLGLPVHTWDNKGYRSELVDYQEKTSVDDQLFVLPTSYREQPLMRR